jgi:hypothetical protein
MADLYSNTNDGTCFSGNQSSWAAARDHAGTTSQTNAATTSVFVKVFRVGTRGGGTAYSVNRSFYYFDTSGITGTVSSATLKIYGYSSTTDGSAIAVKSTAFGGDGGTALHGDDLDAITGYSAGASLAGNATTYGPQILTSSWSTSAYNEFTGTSDLLADMQNNDAVIICFLDYTNDYLNSTPTSSGTFNCGAYFTNNTGTSKDPYIEYELASSGYTHDVIGVSAANIGKVNSVATANIGKINSVD